MESGVFFGVEFGVIFGVDFNSILPIYEQNVAKKNLRLKVGGKKVTCPHVPVFCYMYATIAYRNSVRNVVTIKTYYCYIPV
jgi:hypothetical protein